MDLEEPVVVAPGAAPEPAPGIEARPPAPGLDSAVASLGELARGFARTPPGEKAALLRATLPGLLEAAPTLAARLCALRGIDPESNAAAEVWLAGVAPVIAYVRQLAESLEDIAAGGRPRLPSASLRARPDGRLVAHLVPRTWAERVVASGRETTVLFHEGVHPEDVIAAQAPFYRQIDPEGGVALVLGSDSDAAVGLMDALFAIFVEGHVTLLAPGPLTSGLGAVLERALSPLSERGVLRVLDGVHDAGEPAEPAGVARVIRAAPANVGALIVVPCLYSLEELGYLASSVASQVAHGAALDAAAPRVLVLPAGWVQRGLFLDLLAKAFAPIPTRRAYLPGAAERHARLTGGRAGAVRIGDTSDPARLPWTLVPELDAADTGEPLLRVDPGSSVIAAVSIGSDDPAELLAAAVEFCNVRLQGVRSAQIAVHPIHEEDPRIGAALEQAVIRLRCGAVGVNHWPALLAWAAVAPWGDAELGFRNNARMLTRVDKSIVHGPLLGRRRPAYFADNPDALPLGRRLAAFQAAPSVRGMWSVAAR